MKKAQELEQFIKTWFELFGFNYREIVGSEEVAEFEFVDAPIADNDSIFLENVEKAAEAFGVSTDTLINMNSNILRVQFEKFPYFDLLKDFDLAYQAAFYEPGYKEARLVDEIFRDNFQISDNFPSKFDFDGVIARLKELLIQYDSVFPGAYHTGASMNDLRITTSWFCHFDKINELCNSFLSMVDRAKALFFTALDHDLTAEEISEYNLIVSAVGLKDAVMVGSGNLYYSTLAKRRNVYKSENHKDFFSYVRLSRSRFFNPYRCAEFVTDRELVQQFTSIYPHMKAKMRQYARDVENYRCIFRWSDEPERKPSNEMIEAYCDGKISGEELSKSTGLVVVYVPKESDELGSDQAATKQLQIFSGPETLGGVANADFPYSVGIDLPRMTARLEADRRGA